MSDATLIADLIRAGVDPELVGRVIGEIADARARGTAEGTTNALTSAAAASAKAVDETAEKRRAWDREYRRRLREEPDSIHPNPPDTNPTQVENVISLSSLDSDSKKSKKERAFLCPPDFNPTESHYQGGAKFNLSRSQVDELCDDMRTWSRVNSHRPVARKTDWGLAFHQWIKRHGQENKKRVPKPVRV